MPISFPKAPNLPPGLPGRIVRRLARRPVLVVGTAALGVRLGRDALRVREGEIDLREWRARAGGHFGSVGGGVAGAMAGAIELSVIPGLGPILGGFAGGMAGELGGSKLGRAAIELLDEKLNGKATKEKDGAD